MVWKGVLDSAEAIWHASKFMGPKQPLMAATCPPYEDIDAAICESKFHCSVPIPYRSKTRFLTIHETSHTFYAFRAASREGMLIQEC